MAITKKSFNCPSYGYFQDPDNCEFFYYCSDFGKGHFQGYEFKCPFDLGFDEEKLLCNWKWLVRGCKVTENDAHNNENIDALLQNFPSSILSNAQGSLNDMSKNLDSMDEIMARSDEAMATQVGGGVAHEGRVQFVDGAGQIPAEHRQLDSEPKSRRSFARAIKDQVTDLVGSVTSKVKNLFSTEDTTERRDHPIHGGILPEWFSHLNPFASPSFEVPVRFEEPKPRRKPLIPDHHEPMISIPLLDLPKSSHNNPKDERDRRPKKSPFRPQVHYAKPEEGPRTPKIDPMIPALAGRKNKHDPEMIAVPILTLKDQTIQRRPDTGLPPSNDRAKPGSRPKPEDHHDVLNVASSMHHA